MANESNTFPIYFALRSDGNFAALDKLSSVANAAGADSGQKYAQAFSAKVSGLSDVAAKALAIPRNAGGSLDLSQSINELKRAEQESNAYARALGDMKSAQISAAKSGAGFNAEVRDEIRLLSLLSREGDENTAEIRRRIVALELLEQELNKTKSTTDQVVQSANRGTTAYGAVTNSSRAMRQATVQAGQQFQDIAISIGSGQRASTVFAQQLPQLAFALSGVEGRVGAVARFFAGPWGVALAIGAFALGPLIDGLFKTEKGSDSVGSATENLTNKLDLSKNSYDSLIAVVNEYNKTQEKTEALTYGAIVAAENQARALLKIASAKLAVVKASDPTLDASSNVDAASALAGKGSLVSVLQAQVDKLEGELSTARRAGSNARVEQRLDPKKKIQDSADLELTRLVERNKRKLISDQEYEKERYRIKKKAADDIEALEKKNKPDRVSRGGNPRGVLTNFIDPVQGRITSTPGIRRDPITGKSASHAGLDIAAPNGTPVRAPAGGVVIETGNVAGYGKVVFIDHGAGTISRLAHLSNNSQVTKGQVVNQGDIVGNVGSTGRSTGNHLHYEVRKNGRIADPRTGRFPTDSLGAQSGNNLLEQAKASADAFRSQMDGIAVTVERITGQFDEQPRLIDRINVAQLQLQKIINDIDAQLKDGATTDEQRVILAERRTAALAAQSVAQAAADKPLRDMLRASEKQAALDQLRLEGRGLEVQILERILQLQTTQGPLTDAQASAVADMVADEERRTQELEKQASIQQRQLDLVSQTGDNVRQTIGDLLDGKGFKSFGNLISRQFKIYKDGLAEELTENLFGDVFRKQKLKILGLDKVDEAGQEMAAKINSTAQELDKLSAAVSGAATAFGGVAANDNLPSSVTGFMTPAQKFIQDMIPSAGGISVTGKPQSVDITTRGLIKALGTKIFGKELADNIGDKVTQALRGAAYGQAGGGLIRSVGIKTSNTGSQIGGAFGESAFKAIAPKLFKSLGDFAGPLGSIAGGILGGIIGGLFKKTPKGNVSISNTGVSATGSKSLQGGLNTLGGGVADSVSSIADRLGGEVGNYSVNVRQKGKSFYVGNQKFKDETEAARAALLAAINGGAVVGIRQGAQNLLRAGKDLEKQVGKAADFQSVFDRLRERDDPTGAALDKLDREFGRLKDIFAEAGASAAEYADLERLYGLERADAIKSANEKVTASLKNLYDELTAGNDNRSLRERQAFALTQYDPLKARVAAGDKSAYDEFAEVAKTLLDIERQIFGSQTGYFSRLNEITDLTKTRIESESNIALISQNRPGLFGSASPNNDTGAVVGAITTGNAALLAALNQGNILMQQLIDQGGISGNGRQLYQSQNYF